MPKLNDPVIADDELDSVDVNDDGVEISKTDFGTYHPVMQLKNAADLEYDYEFVGVGFTIIISNRIAKNVLDFYEQLNTVEKDKFCTAIMKHKTFASTLFVASNSR